MDHVKQEESPFVTEPPRAHDSIVPEGTGAPMVSEQQLQSPEDSLNGFVQKIEVEGGSEPLKKDNEGGEAESLTLSAGERTLPNLSIAIPVRNSNVWPNLSLPNLVTP